jgi:sulfite reductase (NADPH) flavoprotein alpha-component
MSIATASSAAASLYSIKNPFPARMIENRRLNTTASIKDTRHIVLGLEGSGLTYQPGAALGVYPKNPPQLVDTFLSLLHLDPQYPIQDPKLGTTTLQNVLTSQYALNRVSRKFVKAISEKLPPGHARTDLEGIVATEELFDPYVWDRDVVDVLLEYPGARLVAEELVTLLPKANPRLYSIASSIDYHPNEVHLTVAVVHYLTHGRQKFGLASGYLSHTAPLRTSAVPIYVQPSKHFHLPPTNDTPLIMVGPGTGIAPFRAFLEQRAFEGARGRNWLFFGDQHHASDFLYEEELLEFQKRGILTRLDTAFSRDQADKIYVQDRMRENAAELWLWIQDGAYFYVCGDARRMAKDVHQALIDIVAQQSGMTAEASRQYVEVTLAKTEHRYLRDVY